MDLSRPALRIFGLLTLTLLLAQAFAPAHAATVYTMTLQTDAPSYSGVQPITMTGVVSPAPGPNTGVIITIKNSVGSVADINEVFPSATNGSFTDVSVPGGNPAWTTGTFSVNATWGGGGATASKVVTFAYSATATTTTTTTSSTSTMTSATSSTSTSTTTSSTSTTTTTTTSSTVPEFPFSVLAVVALIGMAVVAYLSKGTAAAAVEPASGVVR